MGNIPCLFNGTGDDVKGKGCFFPGLLAVVSMACALKMRTPKEVTGRLSVKFGKLWLAAEVVLFVLVGAAVDIRYTMEAGLAAVGMILLALVFRSVGVALCLLGTELGKKERLFCMIAYLPKATVQAAIGSVPLSMGLSCGKIVLSVAVLAILITAPLGALGMDATYRKLLQKMEKYYHLTEKSPGNYSCRRIFKEDRNCLNYVL